MLPTGILEGSGRGKLTSRIRYSHRIHGIGLFTYIYHKKQPNVGKYTIHGSDGIYMNHNLSSISCQLKPLVGGLSKRVELITSCQKCNGTKTFRRVEKPEFSYHVIVQKKSQHPSRKTEVIGFCSGMMDHGIASDL